MSPHETSSNVEDMHALLHELNSLNELHAPDHTEGFMSMIRNAGNTIAAATTGHGNTINAAAAETKWTQSTDETKKAVMKAVLEALVTWISTPNADAKDVEKLKNNLYHQNKVDLVWIEKVNA